MLILPINFIITDLILIKKINHKFPLMVYSLIISQVGTILIKTYNQIKIKHNTKFYILDNVYVINRITHRLIAIFLAGLFTVFPNLSYLADNNGYLVQYLPCIAIIYLSIVFF
jgi:hypothetical protein